MRFLLAPVCLLLFLGMRAICYDEDFSYRIDLIRPGNSRPRSFSSSLSRENHTNPVSSGMDTGSPHTIAFRFPLNCCHMCTSPLKISDKGVQSPFEFCAMVIATLFNILGILDPRSLFYSRKFFPFVGVITALPPCAIQQASQFQTRMLASVTTYKSQALSVVKSFLAGHLVGIILLMLFLCILRVQSPPDAPPFCVVPASVPWQDLPRLGEATNPGPSFAVGTLNVSLSKYHEVISLNYDSPLTLVVTETCHTKESYALVCSKATQARRLKAFCNPRQWVGRKDSLFCGQSGGTVLLSDTPARRSSLKMPWETWTSTRLVESLVCLTPTLMGRVIGIYGYCGTPECHRATNELIRSLLPEICASTLPCFVVGDFNCSLDTLEIWSTLQSMGWADANQYFNNLTGYPLKPTWKGQARIDFILVPPPLIRYFTSFYHTDGTVSDHSFIAANFDLPTGPPGIQVWKTCKDARSLGLDLKEALGQIQRDWRNFDLAISLGSVEEALVLFTQQYEESLAKVMADTCHLPGKSFIGRSKPRLIKKPLNSPTLKMPDLQN